MQEWVWEKGDVLKGNGRIVKKGFIIKFQHINELRFKIKGRLSPGSKGSETAKDVLYFQLGVEDIEVGHLPVSVVDIITNGLWEININHIKKAQMNRKPLNKLDIILDMATKINDGQVVKKVYLELLGNDQSVEINLDIRKKKKDLKGDMEFSSPVSKRDVDKFTRELGRLLPLFVKKDIKVGKRSKHKDDGSPPLEHGPGQEPVKWYNVHGRGNI